MNFMNWKQSRIHRPLAFVMFEEFCVNLLWYQTGIRNLFRTGLLNVGTEKTDDDSIRSNILKYGIQRARFFLPHFSSLPNGAQLLEIGPGGLLIQGLAYAAMGYRYSAIDAFQGKVMSPAALKHYEYFAKHWDELTAGLTAKTIAKQCPDVSSLRYIVSPLEKTNSEKLGTKFDCLFSFGVFEHLSNPSEAIKQTADLVKPNGLMIHRIDFFPHDFWDNYSNPLEFLSVPGRIYHWMYKGRGAPNRYRFLWFKREFERAGFEVEIQDQELYPKEVLSIRPRIDSNVEIQHDSDLLTKSATYLCRKK